MSKITNLDKVIIVLSFIYKQDVNLLRDFLKEFQLSDFQRRYILSRINDSPSYRIETIQTVLKEFYELTENDALFNMSKDITGEIQQFGASETKVATTEVKQQEFFAGLSNDVVFSYINKQGADVKGLLCHFLPMSELKSMFTILDPKTIGNYLAAYHNISPSNELYLEKFGNFLMKKIQTEGEAKAVSAADKDSQFIQMLEMLDNDAFNKIENIRIDQRVIKDYKPYFIQPIDIMLFSKEDRKVIVDILFEKEVLPQFLTLLAEEQSKELLSLLTSRNEAIVKDDMDLYKEKLEEDKIEEIHFDFIKLVRQLQSTGEIDQSIKKNITVAKAAPAAAAQQVAAKAAPAAAAQQVAAKAAPAAAAQQVAAKAAPAAAAQQAAAKAAPAAAAQQAAAKASPVPPQEGTEKNK